MRGLQCCHLTCYWYYCYWFSGPVRLPATSRSSVSSMFVMLSFLQTCITHALVTCLTESLQPCSYCICITLYGVAHVFPCCAAVQHFSQWSFQCGVLTKWCVTCVVVCEMWWCVTCVVVCELCGGVWCCVSCVVVCELCGGVWAVWDVWWCVSCVVVWQLCGGVWAVWAVWDVVVC